MGTFTLVGPGASVDRSGSNPLTFTWTRGSTNEILHRWRLQYRTVGSGTWLNAIITPATNLLTNPSAESALGSEWYAADTPFGWNSPLSRVSGGRHAGSGSWQIERSVLTADESQGRGHRLWNGGTPGVPASLILAVTPGARYNLAAWLWAETLGFATNADAQVQFYNSAGTYVAPSYTWSTQQAAGWNGLTAEVVAPPGAAFALCSCYGVSDSAVGAKVRWDDWLFQRVDNSSNNVANDASGNLWTYKYAGEPTGSASTAPPTPTMVLPPNFLAAGNWEFRIEAWTGGVGIAATQAFSNTVTSTMVTAAAAPTITSPTPDGATVTATPTNVQISYASGQTQAQVRVMDGATVKYDSGSVAISGTSASIPATFAENNVARQIQARTSVGGVWSAWATRSVNVVWTPPAMPTFTAVAEDTHAIGMNHAVRVTVTNPTPSGGQPTVVDYSVEWRVVGSTVSKVAGGAAAGVPFVWYAAPSLALQMRVTVRAADGTTTTTAWQTITGTIALKGVVLYDPADPSTIKAFRFNADGVEDTHEVESALISFSGREYPIAEFGAGTTRSLDVSQLDLKSDAELAQLVELLRRRVAVVYRDKRGRAVLSRMSVGRTQDTFYGYTTGLAFDVLDSWGV